MTFGPQRVSRGVAANLVAGGLLLVVVLTFVSGARYGLAAAALVAAVSLLFTRNLDIVVLWVALQLPYSLQSLMGKELTETGVVGIPLTSLATSLFLACVLAMGCRTWRNLRAPGMIPYMALLAVSAASWVAFGATAGLDAAQRLTSLAMPLVLAVFVYQRVLEKPSRLGLVVHGLLFSVELAVVWALVSDWNYLASHGRLHLAGFLDHPASLGYYCAAFVPFATAFLQGGRQVAFPRGLRAHSGIAAAMGLVGLTLSGTRGAWLAFLVAAVCVAVFYNRRLGVAAVVLVAAIWFSPALVGRVNLLTQQLLAGEEGAGSGRLEIWRAVWSFVKESPWIGHGFNSYFETTQGSFTGSLAGSFAHQDYLFVWLELGIAGPLLLLWLTVSWLRAGIQLGRTRTRTLRPVAGAVVAIAVVFLVGRMFDNLIFMTTLQTSAFVAVAALVAASKRDMAEPHEDGVVEERRPKQPGTLGSPHTGLSPWRRAPASEGSMAVSSLHVVPAARAGGRESLRPGRSPERPRSGTRNGR